MMSRLLLLVALALLLAPPLAAQTPPVGGRSEVFVNSELERYLRVLQLAGTTTIYPWSIRSFSPAEIDRLAPRDDQHPWAGRYDLAPDTVGGLRLHWVAPRGKMVYNGALPYGANDGAVWAGRGLTAAVQAGFAARYGPVSMTIAPVFFHAENRTFDLMPNGQSGERVYADGRSPRNIDLPQRFGDRAYSRIDPGQSTLRLDLPLVAAGISTANQHWGPALEHPMLLGSNAPGFPHLFLGTSAPVNLWIGRAHGRLVWGRLEQSEYSPAADSLAIRLMSGFVAVFTPRGIPGLEVGAGRFFHESWPSQGPTSANLLKPFEGFLKSRLPATGLGPDSVSADDNQLASVFLRWTFPASGLEFYGEFGRNDHSWNLRDFLLEPDHNSGYMLGIHKLWRRSPSRHLALRGELLNTQRSHLIRVRHQQAFYRHGTMRQGHTHHGQILGSAAGYGGAGAIVGADYYHERGRWSFVWTRTLRQDVAGGFSRVLRERDPREPDVVHSIGGESLFFRGRYDITAGLRGVYNLNRNFDADVFSLNASLGLRVGL
jgi:hypothetical protein